MKKLFLATCCLLLLSFTRENIPEPGSYFSPCDIEIDQESRQLFIAGQTAHEVRAYKSDELDSFKSFFTDLPPKAIKIAGDNLLVACSHSEGEVLILDKFSLKRKATIKVGHGACDIAVSGDLSRAYIANQFSNDISVIDLHKRKELKRYPVLRQPMQVSVSNDGQHLFVANFLPEGRADVDTVCAKVSIIDLRSEKIVKHISLANGSNALRGMCLSADGKYLIITHNLGRFQVPTTQLEQGWMNTSALSVIDAQSLEFEATILLDEPEFGAPGSWGIDCNPDYIFVAHSGTHDFSRIEYDAFIAKLEHHENKASLAYDLNFLSGFRERIRLEGNGPRAITWANDKLYVANYFSDNINILDPGKPSQDPINNIMLGDNTELDEVRMGEIYFNDATYCFQSWQSCNGCHPNEARVDALNWDLLNDGMGNPKNCKSMLLAHLTPPSMVSGIRPDAEKAVRAGFEHIQFTRVDEDISSAVDAYLLSLEAIPSPYLVNGKLSPSAKKGKQIFEQIGCGECHPAPLFTDLKQHTMGLQGPFDHQNTWDTPSLIEVWRTGPYLHDGRSANLKEVFSVEKHGMEKQISDQELEWLLAYVLSL